MSEGAKSARAAGKVSVAVFLSRILGVVREQVFARLFGAGLYNDAWLVAFRVPNLLRDLFAEGALSAAFVPTFTEVLKKEGRRQAWHVANLVLSGLLVLLGFVGLILLLCSEWIVPLLAVGFMEVPGKVEVTAALIEILSPFLMLIAMASVAMGMLNTLNHFFLPALAPALFNVALIVGGFTLVPLFDRFGVVSIYGMGVAAILGGLLQYLVQVPALKREGYSFHFQVSFRHPAIQRILRLLGPAVIGVSAVQLNVLVNTQLASFLQDNGPVSWLSYAFRVLYLPIGLFGVAVGVVNLRDISIHAAAGDYGRLKETLANSIKLVAFLAIPSTVGLLLLAFPVIRVLFQYGAFTALDTANTSYALMAYSLGLFAYSCNKVYVPTFYALNDTRTPVRISLLAVAVNLGVNLTLLAVLPEGIRFVGLAFGTSVSVIVSNSLLVSGLKRRLGGLSDYRIPACLARSLLAAVVMGCTVLAGYSLFEFLWPDRNLFLNIVSLGSTIVGGMAVYFLAAILLRVDEAGYVLALVRRGK